MVRNMSNDGSREACEVSVKEITRLKNDCSARLQCVLSRGNRATLPALSAVRRDNNHCGQLPATFPVAVA